MFIFNYLFRKIECIFEMGSSFCFILMSNYLFLLNTGILLSY